MLLTNATPQVASMDGFVILDPETLALFLRSNRRLISKSLICNVLLAVR